MIKLKLLGINLNFYSKKDVLENTLKSHLKNKTFEQIISINTENIVEILENDKFKKIVETSQTHIADGIGVVVAAQILAGVKLDRCTGVDLMKSLCEVAHKDSLSVVLIGGKPNLAKDIAKCQNEYRASTNFYGTEGYKNKLHPTDEEEKELISIVAARKPSLVFVAFGSPFQEIWIDRHKDLFSQSLCMGVGGAFDFLSGEITRAPKIVRSIGLEWLYRLAREPWRWKRQLRLMRFVWLVFREKINLLK